MTDVSTGIVETAEYPRIMRRKEVMAYMGVKAAAFYRGIHNGKIPAGRKISQKNTIWFADEVVAALKELPQEVGTRDYHMGRNGRKS